MVFSHVPITQALLSLGLDGAVYDLQIFVNGTVSLKLLSNLRHMASSKLFNVMIIDDNDVI